MTDRQTAVGFGGIEEGDRVMAEFTSVFNENALQMLVGEVVEADTAEVHFVNSGDRYVAFWDGELARIPEGETASSGYGKDVDLSLLVPVDPALDDE